MVRWKIRMRRKSFLSACASRYDMLYTLHLTKRRISCIFLQYLVAQFALRSVLRKRRKWYRRISRWRISHSPKVQNVSAFRNSKVQMVEGNIIWSTLSWKPHKASVAPTCFPALSFSFSLSRFFFYLFWRTIFTGNFPQCVLYLS